jgi:hypothetical protein
MILIGGGGKWWLGSSSVRARSYIRCATDPNVERLAWQAKSSLARVAGGTDHQIVGSKEAGTNDRVRTPPCALALLCLSRVYLFKVNKRGSASHLTACRARVLILGE